ncbi:MAG: TatD family hydrolase, partial [Firmicutes bacterium]|nr:TatD family hydrolase [Bacillota bacterium]
MSVQLFDSHCHIQDEEFAEDRETVYQRARSQGIGMNVVGYTIESSEKAVEYAQAHEGCWAIVGIHPHEAKTVQVEDYQRLRKLAAQEKVVGIGEIGLDYHYDLSPRDVQRDVFMRQLVLAHELN